MMGFEKKKKKEALQKVFLKVLIMSSLQLHMPTDQTYKSYSMERLVSNVFWSFFFFTLYNLQFEHRP